MKGGNSFNINSVSFGNIVLALNNYKFYIKLNYKDSTDIDNTNGKNGIYYFIFDLKNNQMISSYGLTNKIIVNGNLDIRNSKTFLDMNLNSENQYELILNGKAYKSISDTTNNTDEIEFDENDGIQSTLQMFLSENEIPNYILSLGLKPDQLPKELPGNGVVLKPGDCDTTKLNELMTEQTTYIGIYNSSEDKSNITQVIESNQNDLFTCISSLMDSMDDDTIINVYNFLVDKNNFVNLDTISGKYVGITSAISRLIKSKKLQIPKNTQVAPEAPTEKVTAAAPQSQDIPQQTKTLLLTTIYDEDLKQKLINSLGTKLKNNGIAQNAYDVLFTNLKNDNYIDSNDNTINEIGKIISVAYRKLIIQLYNGGTTLDNVSFRDLYQITNTYLSDNNIKDVKTLEDSWSNISQNILLQFNKLHKSPMEKKQEGGGLTSNAIPIIENNSDDYTDIQQFSEPIIYLNKKQKDNVKSINTTDTNKIPVFGYLTIGKQLMIILLEIQTNNRVPFKYEKPSNSYEKAKNMLTGLLKRFPILGTTFLITVANALTKILIEAGVPMIHVKTVVTTILTGLIGETTTWALTSWLPGANPSPETPTTNLRGTVANMSDSLKANFSTPLTNSSRNSFINPSGNLSSNSFINSSSNSSAPLTNISSFLPNNKTQNKSSNGSFEVGGKKKQTKKKQIKKKRTKNRKYKTTKKTRKLRKK